MTKEDKNKKIECPCPACDKKIKLTEENKRIVNEYIKALEVGRMVPNVVYDNDGNTIHFEDPPIEPCVYHDVACFNSETGDKETKWYYVKFYNTDDVDPPYIGGRLTDKNLYDLTKDKVESGVWHWRYRRCPPDHNPDHPPID